ncbi:MAG TPA: glucokinase [Terriglobales bacterium]
MILAGDIGGTKCNFTLFEAGDGVLHPIFRHTLPTRNAASFEVLLDQLRAQAERQGHELELTAAAFGVAGAVVGDRVLSSNLPWPVEKKAIADALQLSPEKIVLLNDLVAAAASLAHLKNEDLLKLNDGTREERAPMALIAAGTGLGEAILFWDGQRYQISPSEASLTDFAPRNDREFLLLQSLRHRMPRVVTEEIVSGRGFRAIHQIIFPGVQHAFFDEPGVDAAAIITQQAFAGSCAACVETLQIWTEAYGAEAGNMALRILPFGGVYVAGGIAVKILPKLKDGGFVRAFSDKMKLSSALAKIPIYVILNEEAPVIGAAYEALAIAGR